MNARDALAAMQAAIEAADAQPLIFDDQRVDVPADVVALGDGFHMDASRGPWTVDAAGILAALDTAGFTVAPKQDAADGEALRRLREALGPDDTFDAAVMRTAPWVVEAWHLPSLRHLVKTDAPTIAEAADAAREAIEAGR